MGHFQRAAKSTAVIGPFLLAAAVLAGYALAQWGVAGFASGREYDEGVYLLSARALLAGEALFRDIFSSQPPAFIEGLALAMRLGGDRLESGRAFILLWSVVGLLATGDIARQLARPAASASANAGAASAAPAWAFAFAVTGFALSPIWLGLGHTVQAETPAMAAALCSVAVCLRARDRNWKAGWILFAGALFGAALLFKLFVTVFVVPLALLLWLAPATSPQERWRLDAGWLRGVPRRGALFSAGTLAVLGLPLLFYDVEAMRDQAIGLHLAKHAVFRHDRLENLTRIAASLAEDPGVFVLGLLGLALLWRGRVRVAAVWGLLWFLAAVWIVVEQTPVFWRHFILLTPPVAILAGVGTALAPATWKRRGTRLAFGIVAAGLFLSPHALGLARHDWSPTAWAQALDFAAPLSARTGQIVRQLRRHTTEADLVLSDDQMAVYLAGRRSPGMLCDTSYARIASGYLRMRTLIDASRDVRVVAIRENGRLSTLRPFPEWMESNFVPAEPDMESPPVWLRFDKRRTKP